MSTLSTIDFPLQSQGKVEWPRVSTGWVHLSTNHPGPASDYRVIHRQLSTSTGASSLTGSLHQHKHLPTQQHLPAVGEPVSLGLRPRSRCLRHPLTGSYPRLTEGTVMSPSNLFFALQLLSLIYFLWSSCTKLHAWSSLMLEASALLRRTVLLYVWRVRGIIWGVRVLVRKGN